MSRAMLIASIDGVVSLHIDVISLLDILAQQQLIQNFDVCKPQIKFVLELVSSCNGDEQKQIFELDTPNPFDHDGDFH